MKSKRILIIRNAYQKDMGGAEQYALNLAIALKNAGHVPFVVTKVTTLLQKARGHDVRAMSGKWYEHQGWYRGYYLRYPLTVVWYMAVILWHRIDIVHPQGRDDFVFATRAARLLGKRVIWTDHADLKYILDKVHHYNPRMRKWIVSAARHASHVMCVSESEKHSISTVGPELNNLVVVHNGVFIPQTPTSQPKTNSIVVGTNARLVSGKGIAELIKGVAGLKRGDVDVWLVGGYSDNLERYQKIARTHGIEERTRFIDYTPNPDDYVASMDVFVHASYHEAFSLAIVEAAMLARPIIATAVGGTPEIIDESCGVLIPPKDSAAITAALEKLIDDPALQHKLGTNAQRKAIKDFDFQKIVEKQLIPLYED